MYIPPISQDLSGPSPWSRRRVFVDLEDLKPLEQTWTLPIEVNRDRDL
jgi:hypothetical protein